MKIRLNIQHLAKVRGMQKPYHLWKKMPKGTSKATASELWEGKMKQIKFSTIESLCEILRCHPGKLFEVTKDDNKENETSIDMITEIENEVA